MIKTIWSTRTAFSRATINFNPPELQECNIFDRGKQLLKQITLSEDVPHKQKQLSTCCIQQVCISFLPPPKKRESSESGCDTQLYFKPLSRKQTTSTCFFMPETIPPESHRRLLCLNKVVQCLTSVWVNLNDINQSVFEVIIRSPPHYVIQINRTL